MNLTNIKSTNKPVRVGFSPFREETDNKPARLVQAELVGFTHWTFGCVDAQQCAPSYDIMVNIINLHIEYVTVGYDWNDSDIIFELEMRICKYLYLC